MKTVEKEIGSILTGTISSITQRSIFNRLGGLATTPVQQLSAGDRETIMRELENSVRLFARSNSSQLIASCARALSPGSASGAAGSLGVAVGPPTGLALAPKKLPIEQEKDIATARLEAWSEAVRIGLSKFASVKVATAVSELARNIVFYAGKGTVELRSVKDDSGVAGLQIIATTRGRASRRRSSTRSGPAPTNRSAAWAKGWSRSRSWWTTSSSTPGPGLGTTVTCVFKGER